MPRRRSETPWLDRREPGNPRSPYYAWWYSPGANRVEKLSLRTTNPDEAKARFAVFLSEGGDVVRGNPSVGLTVTDALDQYLKEHAKVRCAAYERQEYATRQLKGFFGDTHVGDIDIPLSRAYIRWRMGAGAKESTIARELGVLSAAANHAIKWRRLRPDQKPSVEPPRVPKKKVGFFTPEEIETLMREAPPRLRAFIVLAYFTAARRRSIELLELKQIDLEAKPPRAYLHKDGEVQTKKRRATVPLNDACVDQIRMLTAVAEEGQKYLFGTFRVRRYTNSAGKLVIRNEEIQPRFYKQFATLCEKLGFPEGKRHPHLLRHSRATHLLQSGRSIFQVANLLGDTVMTVQMTYGHHTPEHAAGAESEWDSGLMAALS